MKIKKINTNEIIKDEKIIDGVTYIRVSSGWIRKEMSQGLKKFAECVIKEMEKKRNETK